MSLSTRHLLQLEGTPKSDLELILDTAESFREILDRPIKKVPPLRGKTVVNLFYEPPRGRGFRSNWPKSGFRPTPSASPRRRHRSRRERP